MEEHNLDSGEYTEAAAPANPNEETYTGEATTQEAPVEQNVPLAALQSERENRQRLESEVKMMRDHLSLIEAQKQTPRPASDQLEGLENDDDILTVKDFKKAMGKYQSHYQGSLKELKMAQKNPDYQEVVTKYLPDVVKANPAIGVTLNQTQDLELAYYLAKNSEAYKADTKSRRKNADAVKMMQNSERSGSLSSVGSTSPMNTAKRYAQMSDDEFRSLANRNMQ